MTKWQNRKTNWQRERKGMTFEDKPMKRTTNKRKELL
jgi:hypothetical protein